MKDKRQDDLEFGSSGYLLGYGYGTVSPRHWLLMVAFILLVLIVFGWYWKGGKIQEMYEAQKDLDSKVELINLKRSVADKKIEALAQGFLEPAIWESPDSSLLLAVMRTPKANFYLPNRITISGHDLERREP